ncbi:hypothetical protein EG329_006585 [Mollisiaceae sp. DMI_Dod_QoI]|nr:hypothetical protein EG329_006585 [Helotiales sp. DMI_Dod_QoI]
MSALLLVWNILELLLSVFSLFCGYKTLEHSDCDLRVLALSSVVTIVSIVYNVYKIRVFFLPIPVTPRAPSGLKLLLECLLVFASAFCWGKSRTAKDTDLYGEMSSRVSTVLVLVNFWLCASDLLGWLFWEDNEKVRKQQEEGLADLGVVGVEAGVGAGAVVGPGVGVGADSNVGPSEDRRGSVAGRRVWSPEHDEE